MGILADIMAHKLEELESYRYKTPLVELKEKSRDCPEPVDFKQGILGSKLDFAIIAEIKKRSPSKGLLRRDFNPVSIAQSYSQHGAACLSVLTDEHFFGGHLDDLRGVRRAVNIPLMRKDFIWDPYQVYAAREAGADALLLIAAVLGQNQMEDLMGLATSLKMATLVEVFNQEECERAVAIGSPMIGVNHRDLQSFEVDLSRSEALFPLMPSGTLKVSESGLKDRQTLKHLTQVGAQAFLMGEAFMKAESPGEALGKMLGEDE